MLKILKLCLNVYSYFLKKILELYYYKLEFFLRIDRNVCFNGNDF